MYPLPPTCSTSCLLAYRGANFYLHASRPMASAIPPHGARASHPPMHQWWRVVRALAAGVAQCVPEARLPRIARRPEAHPCGRLHEPKCSVFFPDLGKCDGQVGHRTLYGPCIYQAYGRMPPTQETQLRHDKSFSIDAKGGRGGGGRCLQTRAKQDRSFEACFFKKSLMDAKIFVNLVRKAATWRS